MTHEHAMEPGIDGYTSAEVVVAGLGGAGVCVALRTGSEEQAHPAWRDGATYKYPQRIAFNYSAWCSSRRLRALYKTEQWAKPAQPEAAQP